MKRILGTDRVANVLLVGVGNLGRALLSFRGFSKRGFEVVAAFDNDADKVGQLIEGPRPLRVQPLDEMGEVVKAQSIRVGILTVPASAAQAAADFMAEAGIRAILNFAPVRLQVSASLAISSVDLAVHLEQLSFQLSGGLER